MQHKILRRPQRKRRRRPLRKKQERGRRIRGKMKKDKKKEESFSGKKENPARGRLKIFFGYAEGAGKTYNMLEAACSAKRRGVDVVAGFVETHGSGPVYDLLKELEMLPAAVRKSGGEEEEFDLDLAIERKPQLLLVDELAHENPAGSRHLKRYQDVEELLSRGIDVYTTVNVQHIESLNDIVYSISGIGVSERIPDYIFDGADQVELVDIEPKELIERRKEGKSGGEKSGKRPERLPDLSALVALRELALRRCADRVNKISENIANRQSRRPAEEHILVCLSSSPTNAKIIRTAARMADAFRGDFTALFVETPDFVSMSGENRERLRQNTRLAQQLGAGIERVYGEDVALQISEFARISGVTKIVLGRSSTKRGPLFRRSSLTERITQLSPDVDIHIIPDQNTPPYRHGRRTPAGQPFEKADIAKSLLVLAAATGVSFLFHLFGLSEANVVTVYVLGILVTAMVTTRRIYSLICSGISVLLFDFLFTSPHFSFTVSDAKYFATFPVMLLSAFLTSSLALRIKRQARQSAETAYRTKILFDTDRMLQNEKDADGIVSVTCRQLTKLLGKNVIWYRAEDGKLSRPWIFYAAGCREDDRKYRNETERTAAEWVYHNNRRAGASTDTLGDALCLYLSVRVSHEVFGVVGIALDGEALDGFDSGIILSILGECALALKNEKTSRERENAMLMAENEQLRANLLRSISHDLRTPLTSISGNAGILLSNEKAIGEEQKRQIYADIYDDSLWLINLVENLLYVTRIEDGTMQLRKSTELLDDILAEAVRHARRRRGEHKIRLQSADDLILVKADARLIMQVAVNIIDNAMKYTPPGSDILVETGRTGAQAFVRISDTGDGISDEAKEHVFDMFYTGENRIADSRRSLGLGLALCRSIISAHGGTISVSDNVPHGAVFTFTLPAADTESRDPDNAQGEISSG